jgi:hypothetical protein
MYRITSLTRTMVLCAILLPLTLHTQIVSAQQDVSDSAVTTTAVEGRGTNVPASSERIQAATTLPTQTNTDPAPRTTSTAQPPTPDYESLMEPFYLFRQRYMGTDVSGLCPRAGSSAEPHDPSFRVPRYSAPTIGVTRRFTRVVILDPRGGFPILLACTGHKKEILVKKETNTVPAKRRRDEETRTKVIQSIFTCFVHLPLHMSFRYYFHTLFS